MEVRDRILIIEDDRSIRKFFRTILEANRYDVISADTGEEGYSLITSQCPDLVILDLGLPDIDGMEILRRLRKWSGMPVVVISARSHEKDKVEALDERNIQVELRARSRTLSLLRGTLMAVLILSLIGALANPEGELVYGGMMVVSGVLYTLSLFIELACSFYYEGRI